MLSGRGPCDGPIPRLVESCRMCECVCVCVYVCMYVCMYVCVCVRVCVSLSEIRCNYNPLHYKVHVDRGQTKIEERKQNARMKEEDRVWHIPTVLLRRFRPYAVSSQRLRINDPTSNMKLPQIHDIVQLSHNRWRWRCSN